MKNNSILEKLRQCFSKVIPATDARSKIAPLEYVINLIFGFVAHTNSFSLESMRRQMISQTQKKTNNSSFWERLSRKRLTNFLRLAIRELLRPFGSSIIGSGNRLEQLGVIKIRVVDSTYFKLWDGAADDYPGTGTNAGIKWHAGFDILTGKLHWFELTQGSTHDRKCFPEIESLRLSLVIVDLGYWDFNW